jgi:hypothetical protein
LQWFLQQTWISSVLENLKIPLFNNFKMLTFFLNGIFWIKNVSKVDLQRFLQQTWISSVLVLLLGNVCWRFYRVTFGEAWEIVMCIMDIFLLGDYFHFIIYNCIVFGIQYFFPFQLSLPVPILIAVGKTLDAPWRLGTMEQITNRLQS